MTLRWLRFRQRMALLVATSGFVLVAVSAVGAGMVKRSNEALSRLQDRYIPLLALDRDLNADFSEIRRTLQDAATAKEPRELVRADQLRDILVAELRAGGAVLRENGGDPVALERDFLAYYDAARRVSEALMAGVVTEELVVRMETMRDAQISFSAELDASTSPNSAAVEAAVEQARGAQETALSVDVVASVALLVAMAVLSVRIAGDVLRSLDAISAGMDRLAKGQFNEPIEVVTEDEFGDLARRANTAASLLRNSYEDLEGFSYSVSHDLRAPLRAIDGFSVILREDYGDRLDDDGRRVLDVIRGSTQRMGRLIDDLLAWSRLGRRGMQMRRLDMTAMATAAAEEARQLEPGRSIDIDIGPLPAADADEGLVTQVWLNLLGNAVKYTRRQTEARIRVEGRLEHGEAIFAVVDNGVGFDETYRDKLFGVFQRLHREDEFEGTGIGLALVKRIVERHGGRVGASGRLGEGATFWFALPMA